MVRTYVAFLGGINVGGHRVQMGVLRDEFAALGFADVRTFIASGNVIFSSTGRPDAMQRRIEAHLADRLGYDVPTFLRTAREVEALAAFAPFGELAAGHSHFVAFLHTAPSAQARRATEALGNEQEVLEVHGTELHRRIRGGFSDSTITPAQLARALGQPSTTRNSTSIRKLAAGLVH